MRVNGETSKETYKFLNRGRCDSGRVDEDEIVPFHIFLAGAKGTKDACKGTFKCYLSHRVFVLQVLSIHWFNARLVDAGVYVDTLKSSLMHTMAGRGSFLLKPWSFDAVRRGERSITNSKGVSPAYK